MAAVDHELDAENGGDERQGNGNGSRREGGSKTRLLSLDDLDRRTKAFQVAHDTKHAIISDLGGVEQLSMLELIQVENAAVDAAVLRDLQVRWLRGEEVEAPVLATIENVFNRTAAMLGTKRRTKDVLPSLQGYAATRQGSTEGVQA